jgi:hypothetical protein
MININNGAPGDDKPRVPVETWVIIAIVLGAALCGALALVLLP